MLLRAEVNGAEAVVAGAAVEVVVALAAVELVGVGAAEDAVVAGAAEHGGGQHPGPQVDHVVAAAGVDADAVDGVGAPG